MGSSLLYSYFIHKTFSNGIRSNPCSYPGGASTMSGLGAVGSVPGAAPVFMAKNQCDVVLI